MLFETSLLLTDFRPDVVYGVGQLLAHGEVLALVVGVQVLQVSGHQLTPHAHHTVVVLQTVEVSDSLEGSVQHEVVVTHYR